MLCKRSYIADIWKKYHWCIIVIFSLIGLISFIIISQFFNVQTVKMFQTGNQTIINVYPTNGLIQYVYPLIYVIVGILTTFLINEFRSVKSEEKVVSVLKADLKTNSKILKFNKKRVELELRTKETTGIPLKLFKSDFWDLMNYNPPNKLIDEDLYSKIGDAAIIMNSINELNQIKESHKAFNNKEEVKNPKFFEFNSLLRKDIDSLDSLLKYINTLL